MNFQKKTNYKYFVIFPLISFGLGTWQIYRYQWKKNLIQTAQNKVEEEPVELTEKSVNDLVSNKQQELEFRRVYLEGNFVKGASEIHLGPRSYDGFLGYYIISPFKLVNGKSILVNRGWVPLNLKDENFRITSGTYSNETVDVLGLVSKIKEKGSMFTPENQPQKNQWYYLDVPEMAKQLDALPLMVNAIEELPKTTVSSSIKRFDTNIESHFYNKHISYIGTWYGLTACLTFIYFKYMKPGIKMVPK
ncbi:surf1 family protein [Tieghemostelium lacteum]|uniref:SURF1-like protein n=1 Tax=Tieghemostelium lacteum TaxID=361077 RepID=A0A151ZAY9_TIELA|nr:surf1 family protein [Tieghemostelium lacteum]|eukprot:KYQ91101.1 surf1 family protein [Tieghemostelium lacteum]